MQISSMRRQLWQVVSVVSLAALGCQSGRFVKEEQAGASASTKAAQAASATAPPAVPGPPPAPKGPVGVVTGVIHVSGDEAPQSAKVMAEIPEGKCKRAADMYGKLFREGPGRTLGDVLVAITDYAGSVPSLAGPVQVTAADCAFEKRTVALAVWQTLEVKNKGPEAVMPQLMGSTAPAVMVAVPGGAAIPLPFKDAGQYVILDRSHPFAQVDTFVLNFPTFAVTGVDGAYRIERIPAGEAKLTAYLPATGKKVERSIVVAADQVQQIDLTINFDLKTDGPKPSGADPAQKSH
jgi:hypothetical protein